MIRQTAKALHLGWLLLDQWRKRSDAPAVWLQETARRCADLLGLEITIRGTLPENGLIVSNHLGYLDIIALSSVLPCRFVAKADVAAWPVFGAFAARGGTIFINRRQRGDVTTANAALARALAEPRCTVVFPEGTSSDGSRVLPFHSSLLEPAIAADSPVTPLGIAYPPEAAYHGELTLLPHLWQLFGFSKIKITLNFGSTRQLLLPRKTESSQLREEVAALAFCPVKEMNSLSPQSAI